MNTPVSEAGFRPFTAPADVHVTRDVMVTLRDGVRLATDIYRPAKDGAPLDAALPVLLERTPYDKLGVNHGDRTREDPEPRSKPELAVDFVRGGYVVAMTGASRAHNIITGNISAVLNLQLADSSCEVYAADMRVKVTEPGDYTYPDIAVACGDIAFEDAEFDTLPNPMVIRRGAVTVH
ncbi:MAG: Uma2 family endonuclease [Dehalococcoidia bacterium]|nr:Uma2 family endonuclease [Dehalococcoidia bacterium]